MTCPGVFPFNPVARGTAASMMDGTRIGVLLPF
jgi:hypothetical protein